MRYKFCVYGVADRSDAVCLALSGKLDTEEAKLVWLQQALQILPEGKQYFILAEDESGFDEIGKPVKAAKKKAEDGELQLLSFGEVRDMEKQRSLKAHFDAFDLESRRAAHMASFKA